VATNVRTLSDDGVDAERTAVELGLKPEEYQNVVAVQGRTPSLTELYIYSLMWSEHCSYKHSKKQLRNFSSAGEHVLQGPGENAGVISVGDGWAVAFKMESHNHPSAIEPFQGAATGVGGIIRDIFTMGARPIACLDSLRFGELSHPRQRYLFDGSVAGIGSYGNCLGVPTVGGEVYFDDAYEGNCLINAMAIGLMREEDLTRAVGSGPGNYVVLIGSSTGRDGIGGASSLASQEFDEAAEDKRPAVQVGDPFEEKLLIEVCLECLHRGLFVALGDLGAAGLTSSASEMASRGGVGLDIDVRKVPQREQGMQPFEIMVSESQERMLAVVKPEDYPAVEEACTRWGVACSHLGSITDTGRFVVRDSNLPAGEDIVADMPAEMLAESAPEYAPESLRPAYLDELQSADLSGYVNELEDMDSLTPNDSQVVTPGSTRGLAPRSQQTEETRHSGLQDDKLTPSSALLTLLASPNICSRQWIWRQYDHQVQNNTAILPGGDAAVIRIGDTGRGATSTRAIAVSTDCNGRYCYLDPYRGAQIALAEGMRNLACVGAEPAAITDCLNFGSPEKPEVFYTFAEAVRGLSKACLHYHIPVVSGNVSFYNESFGNPIYPTPTIGIVGLIDDVSQTCQSGFAQAGDTIILVGETGEDLGGSEYLKAVHNLVAGTPPALDLDLEGDVQAAVREGVRAGLLHSAHDCSEGGAAVALAECCLLAQGRNGAAVGAQVALDDGLPAAASLFAETQSRIIVSLADESVPAFLDILQAHEVPFSTIGTTGGDTLAIEGRLELPLTALSEAFNPTLEHLVTQ
jgi:phosphoribosylformylglycinamidine synthase